MWDFLMPSLSYFSRTNSEDQENKAPDRIQTRSSIYVPSVAVRRAAAPPRRAAVELATGPVGTPGVGTDVLRFFA